MSRWKRTWSTAFIRASKSCIILRYIKLRWITLVCKLSLWEYTHIIVAIILATEILKNLSLALHFLLLKCINEMLQKRNPIFHLFPFRWSFFMNNSQYFPQRQRMRIIDRNVTVHFLSVVSLGHWSRTMILI